METARDGEEALECVAEMSKEGARFDLIILDLTVPGGMGGKQTAERILSTDPSARILVSSGYSDNAVMSAPEANGFVGVLPKPYNAAQLCAAVQRALREGR